MKTKKLESTLKINKKTIANLTTSNMKNVKGGALDDTRAFESKCYCSGTVYQCW